jgi:hypothetical protein
MNPKIDNKKFYLTWKYIEKKAFSPDKTKKGVVEKWLQQLIILFNPLYGKTWNAFPQVFNPSQEDFKYEFSFQKDKINIRFKFSIALDFSKFNFELKWDKKTEKDKSNLQFGYDSQYQGELDFIDSLPLSTLKLLCAESEPAKKQSQKGKKPDDNSLKLESLDEIQYILENMINHPAIHCHIYSELWNGIQKKDRFIHEIRLGMPTTNPFLFIYRVFFQFLSVFDDDGKKKKDELKRIANVIFENRENISIAPGLLFK